MMRLIFGMILGVLVTIGAAYVHDTVWVTPTGAPGDLEQRHVVNWDVVQTTARNLGSRAREQVDKLTK